MPHMLLSLTSLFYWSTGILLFDHLAFLITMRLISLILMVKTLQLRKLMVSTHCSNISILFCICPSFFLAHFPFLPTIAETSLSKKIEGCTEGQNQPYAFYVRAVNVDPITGRKFKGPWSKPGEGSCYTNGMENCPY